MIGGKAVKAFTEVFKQELKEAGEKLEHDFKEFQKDLAFKAECYKHAHRMQRRKTENVIDGEFTVVN